MLVAAADAMSWPVLIGLFGTCCVVIAVVGTRMARVADDLADATGLGEAIVGAVLLGASTSLPGIVTSVTAAAAGHAELAFSNAIGGIAAQTVFLAIADMFYWRANLEHAAASLRNIMQGALLIVLLATVVLIMSGPVLAVGRLHVGSAVLLVAYVLGVRMIGRVRQEASWTATRTPETVVDEPPAAKTGARRLARMWLEFWVGALVLGAAGYAVARSGVALSERTGLSETLVGALFTAIATSLPELVTSVAAVRRGALTLAVGNIIGGNSFDVLFVAFADAAYAEGSIYHAVGGGQYFMIARATIQTGVLILGLLRREKRGIANIGFESFLILTVYLLALVVIAAAG